MVPVRLRKPLLRISSRLRNPLFLFCVLLLEQAVLLGPGYHLLQRFDYRLCSWNYLLVVERLFLWNQWMITLLCVRLQDP
ncbi:hypothetical protein HanPI659440_Chr03g0123281 [Helianthus annuus]|nr:hypothetical protein HanPI659440_Chr03g0123281 [Helianthus annuus]